MSSYGRIEVAGFRRRGGALAFDVVLASALSLGIIVMLHSAGVAREGATANNVVAALAVPLYFTPQWAVGGTLGMRLFGLTVARQVDGHRPGVVRALV